MNKAPTTVLLVAVLSGVLFLAGPASAQPATPLVLQAKIGGGAEGSILKNAEGSFTVIGGGVDIWDASDAFTFHYFEVTGDFDLRVRVDSFAPVSRWAKAGLMVRESLAPASRMAFAYVEPPAVPTQAGNGNGADDRVFGHRTGIPGAGPNGGQHAEPITGRPVAGYPNAWLRLQRSGSVVTSYHSGDGSDWAVLAAQDTANWQSNGVTVPLSTNLLLGLGVVVATTGGLTAQAEFRDFDLIRAPAITSQPTNAMAALGGNATFTVVASGSAPLSYQWWLGDQPLSGATASAVALADIHGTNAGPYRVVVTNPFGSVTSTVATLTVVGGPAIAVAGNGAPIANGDTTPEAADGTDFGTVHSGATLPLRSFTVLNNGGGTLLLSDLTLSGAFALVEGLSNALAAGQSDTFTVRMLTTTQGTNTGQVSIENSSAGASPFQFTLRGIVTAPTAPFVEETKIGGGAAGSIVKNGEGSFTVTGGGTDIWGSSDGFTFHYYIVTGDFDVRVRVETFFSGRLHPKAGLMVRESTAPNSRMVFAFVEPPTAGGNAAYMSYRTGVGDLGGYQASGGAGITYPNAWLRLKREGTRFTAYHGATGSNWTELASQDTAAWPSNGGSGPLPDPLLLGLAVTVANTGTPTVQAEFRDYGVFISPPAISEPPGPITVKQGQTAVFSVTVSGTPPFHYQWRLGSAPLSGATNATLTLTNAQSSQAGNYSVVITNAAGSITSSPVALTVILPPAITVQPASQAAAIGSNATFTVGVSGSAPFTYQWRFNDLPLSGGTSSSLLLTNVQNSNAGPYSVIVSNAAGAITSAVATLTVYTNYGRFLRVVTTNTTAGSNVTVPVLLAAQGNENGVGFSISFDASVATILSASVGSNATAATLNLNTNQAASGRVGMNLVLPTDATFAAGTQEVVLLTLAISPSSGDLLVPLLFLDQPVAREISDALAEPLAAIYFNGALNIGGAIEGDVTPLPNGNGVVTATDWVKIGRYSSGLEIATNGIQFQRTDCAPRSTAGGGTLTVGDWVQAGRYVASMDPPTPAGGPTMPLSGFAPAAPLPPVPMFIRSLHAAPSTTLRVTNQSANPGQPFQVSLMLESSGGESAMGFSLSFNPEWLQFTGFTPGTSAAGATLNVNTSQSATGRLAIAFSLPVGGSFQVGTRELVRLGFRAATIHLGVTSITFSDQPSRREVSDAFGNALDTTYVDGLITLLPPLLHLQPPLRQPAGHYRLLVENADGSAIDSNRLSTIDLLSATNLGLSFSNWVKVTNPAVLTNGIMSLDDLASTNFPRRFYRAVERP